MNSSRKEITAALKDRIIRFLSMDTVRNSQKVFLRSYLAKGIGGAKLTCEGARKVIYITIRQLEEDGHSLLARQ